MKKEICNKIRHTCKVLLSCSDENSVAFIKETVNEALGVLLLCKYDLERPEDK